MSAISNVAKGLLGWYMLLVPPAEEECRHGYGIKVCPSCGEESRLRRETARPRPTLGQWPAASPWERLRQLTSR